MIAPELEPFAVDVDSLTELPGNPRRGDVEAVKRSYAAFGQQKPIKVQRRGSEVVVIDGNHQLRAARELGWDKIAATPFVMDDGNGGTREATVAEANAYALAANHTSDLGTYDEADLLAMMQSVYLNDVSMFEATSYSESDLLGAGDPPLTDPDDVPEPPVTPVTKLGDLWLLGPHRVMCGDATDRAAYEKVSQGEQAALCLTDPPYGVGVDYGSGVTDDEASIGVLIEQFIPLVVTHAERALVTGGHTLLWLYPRPSWVLAWVEPAGVGRSPWGFTCTQLVLAYGSDPYLAAGMGSRPDTFIGKGEGPSSDQHPVAKPMAVWKWLMERGSIRSDDLVLDPFAGSGTTVIAAEVLGRRAACVELSPHYVDVICKRYQDFTGTKPVLESTGEPHDFT